MRAQFREDWFAADACTDLAALVVMVADVPGLIVEIGAWEGRSTVAMANAAAPRLVHSVDTWLGSAGEVSSLLAARRDVFAQWCMNIAELTAGNVRYHKMDWRRYLTELSEPVALVFIDAEHSYDAVAGAIAAVRQWMSDGGIVCGDDIHYPPVQSAVRESFKGEALEQMGPLWVRRGITA